MEINEAFRRIVAGHLRLVAIAVLVPIALVATLATATPKRFVASSRIQASSATIGSDTEANSVLNRVKGIATSTAIVERALGDAQISGRDPQSVAGHEIGVTRFGSSAVMSISVTDRSAAVARDLSSALATAVVDFIGGPSGLQPQALLTQLTDEQTQLYTQRQRVVAQLGTVKALAATAGLSAQLSTIDQELGDVTATLRQLQVTIATDTSASVISQADAATQVRAPVVTDLVLAGIAGLVGGLLLASLLEVVRPRVADARAFARELDVPLLGGLSPAGRPVRRFTARLRPDRHGPPGFEFDDGGPGPGQVRTDRETLVALRRCAAAAQLHTLALLDADDADEAGQASRCAGMAASLSTLLAPHGAPASNGRVRHPGVLEPAAVASSDGARAGRDRVQTQLLRTPCPPPPLRVIAFSASLDGQAEERCGLLVVAQSLARYARLQRVQDLAAASGWPVLGVLEYSARRRGERP